MDADLEDANCWKKAKKLFLVDNIEDLLIVMIM